MFVQRFQGSTLRAGISRRSTTILCVQRDNELVLIGDGQVSKGQMVCKPNARKIRHLMNGKVLCGFAGSTADAITLLEKLELKVEVYPGQLKRACVELAKQWRTDKYLRPLEASMIVCASDPDLVMFEITGNGDVLEPADNVLSIGSGSPYAIAAARALIDVPGLSAEDIARKAMRIAADLCVYTNHTVITERLTKPESSTPTSPVSVPL